jgi:hypothetical protein
MASDLHLSRDDANSAIRRILTGLTVGVDADTAKPENGVLYAKLFNSGFVASKILTALYTAMPENACACTSAERCEWHREHAPDDGDEPDPVDPRATTVDEAVRRARRIMSGLTDGHQCDVLNGLAASLMSTPLMVDDDEPIVCPDCGMHAPPHADDDAPDELDEPLSYDPEIQVIATVADALETLDSAAKGRVIRWASDRYVSVFDNDGPF